MKYKIAITLIPGIGSINAKKLIAYSGSVEGVFREKLNNLMKVPGIGPGLANEIHSHNIFGRAEEEIKFIERYGISCLFYLDDDYPGRLKHCEDSPVIVFQKGKCNLNETKVLSVVGTRNATVDGKKACIKIISDLSERHPGILIVSGLAYGIDITAHKAAMDNKTNTVAVLGHGLDLIYPSIHKNYATKIIKRGAIISEFLSKTIIDKNNFVKRNRIIAGLSDGTLVVESGIKGGSIITANIANSYNRDVFALPGRPTDEYSAGCNNLIKTNRAALVENAGDIEYLLGWESKTSKKKVIQKELFTDLCENEKFIMVLIKEEKEISIDQISNKIKLPISVVSSLLLNLEFAGLLKCSPGKIYSIL